jgi:hypothetical protein
MLPIVSLKPHSRNPRTHSRQQIRQIADSIRTFGFTNPVLVDRDGGIIAGHGRIEGAKLLGIKEVPTICLADMTEAQKRAYIIADNRLAENAGWDRELLALELNYIHSLDIDFDLSITGFATAEVDLLLGAVDGGGDGDDNDEIPAADPSKPPITKPGDLWILGNHRLLCDDARLAESFDRLMAGERAQMVFTDPPYNVAIDGNVCGTGSIKHREFAMASGDVSTGAKIPQ